jgi:hypothetical protein
VVVAVGYHCPKCGTHAHAEYEDGERCYGDLPACSRGCDVPYAVMDAIASWLDERVANGAGEPVRASARDLCGFDRVER